MFVDSHIERMCVRVCVYARVCFFVRMTNLPKTHHLRAVEGRGGEGRGGVERKEPCCGCGLVMFVSDPNCNKKKRKNGNTAVFVHDV